MATQVQTATEGVQEKASSASETAQGYTSSIMSGIEGIRDKVTVWGQGLLDRFFPPEQRATFLAKIQESMLANPKLSTFLGMNIAITGVPLFLFLTFTLSIFIFALIVGLLLGLLAAVLFTVFCAGLALTIVLPAIFFTTMAACFLFLWGLGGYYFLKWANGSAGEKPEYSFLGEGGSIGDSLNNMTGGKLSGFMGSAKAERAKGDISGFSDEHTKPNPQPEKKAGQQDGETKQQQHQNGNVDNTQNATKATGADNASKGAANPTNAVKGGVGGLT